MSTGMLPGYVSSTGTAANTASTLVPPSTTDSTDGGRGTAVSTASVEGIRPDDFNFLKVLGKGNYGKVFGSFVVAVVEARLLIQWIDR